MDQDEPPRRKRASDLRKEEAVDAAINGTGITTSMAAAIAISGISNLTELSPKERLARFDRMPRELRDMANEYGFEIVALCQACGVWRRDDVLDRCETLRATRRAEVETIYSRPLYQRRTQH